ncbi:hypothetical protein [Streptomyces mirabilis]|uniref:hypothetical protein n=1 Tax=Streptomyces mirabilis TaxID=68239 RepID=UPI00365CDBEA
MATPRDELADEDPGGGHRREGRTVLRPSVIRAGDIAVPYDGVLPAVKATGLERAVDDMAAAVGPHFLVVPVFDRSGTSTSRPHASATRTSWAACRRWRPLSTHGSGGEVVAVPGGTAFARVDECASVAATVGYPVPAPALQQTPATVTEAGSPLTLSPYRDYRDVPRCDGQP